MARACIVFLLLAGCRTSVDSAPAVQAAREAVDALMELRTRMKLAEVKLDGIATELQARIYVEPPAGRSRLVKPVHAELVRVDDADPEAIKVFFQAEGLKMRARVIPNPAGGWMLSQLYMPCDICAGKDPDCLECDGSGYLPFLHAWLPHKPRPGRAAGELELQTPEAATYSLIDLRFEAERRAHDLIDPLHRESLGWADRHLTAYAAMELREALTRDDGIKDPALMHGEPDRRRAIAYVALPRIARGPYEDQLYGQSVRIRFLRVGAEWKVVEEALFCERCESHRDCGSCDATGVDMQIGRFLMCTDCRAGLDCASCGGAGYVAGFSLLRIRF